MVLHITSRSCLIVARQPGTEGDSNFPYDALTPEVPPENWKLAWVQVNIQNTLIATVLHAESISGWSYVRCQLWDLFVPEAPIWTKFFNVRRFSHPTDAGILKPVFDASGRFVGFSVGERTLEIYSTNPIAITRGPSWTAITPWRISVFAIRPGVPVRIATAEPYYTGQPHLRQEHWHGMP